VKARVLALALVLGSCASPLTGSSPSPSPPATSSAAPSVASAPSATPRTFTPTSDAKSLLGGCGRTTVVEGGVPRALVDATGNNTPNVPYAVAHPATAAGFLFGYPLHVVPPGTNANKILWVVGTARTGDLVIEGHPLGASTPTVRYTLPSNSGPGEIYPSGVEVPMVGCWQFTLRWSDQVAEIELDYR
jgi:hypothetical protein